MRTVAKTDVDARLPLSETNPALESALLTRQNLVGMEFKVI
jgi:hypothetical protein